MHTLIESIEDKYDGEDGRDYGFIVFVSSSPECKKGMFPPVMTLCDYDIETVGKFQYVICLFHFRSYYGKNWLYAIYNKVLMLHVMFSFRFEWFEHSQTSPYF